MRSIRRDAISSAALVVLTVGLFLLPSCGGMGGSDRITIPAGCGVTQADLQGTWKVRTRTMSFVCPTTPPPGTTRNTNGSVNTFTGVTAAGVGAQFVVTGGAGLVATVDTDSCHITYSFIDTFTNARFDCFCTFDPATRTAGEGTEEGHCDGVAIDTDGDGARETSCAIATPFLGSFIVVE